MAASGSDEDDEEQFSSSDASGDDDGSSNSSSDGSDGSASPSDESDDSDDGSDDEEEEDDDTKSFELKQAQVRSDIQELRLMVGEMEKIKQRLLFRLERERQAKLEEANWHQQQQQLADEERQRQRQQQQLAKEEEELKRQQLQQQKQEVEKKAQEEERIVQEAAQHQQQLQSLPERSFVEIGVQTEVITTTAECDDHIHSNVVQQAPHSMHALSHDRQSASPLQQVSVAAEGQSARLSLYDLGKSYGLKELTAPPPNHQSNHQERSYRSAQAPLASDPGNTTVPLSEASDADTFFIRRDSNRTSWQPDAPDQNNSFRRSQGSALDSGYGENEHSESPTSQAGARTNRSAFETLRNSILSSIHEGDNAPSASASIASSKLFESRRSRMGSAMSSAANGDGESTTKTDEQCEQEAIQSLLFGR